MPQLWVTLLLAVSDFLAINLGTVALLWMKHAGVGLASVERAWRERHPGAAAEAPFSFALEFYLYDALPLICLGWLVLFVFNGLYRLGPTTSRFDEAVRVFRVVTLGVVLLFIITFDLRGGFTFTRALLASYWIVLIVLVATGRISLRSLQMRLLAAGVGRSNTVIVGTDERGHRLLQALDASPAQGYEVIGFVRAPGEAVVAEVGGLPVLGEVEDLGRIVGGKGVKAVLIALRSNSHEEVLRIVDAVGGAASPVAFGITPDLYDIVTGHVRTQQIYGVPLMELRPQLMPPWESAVKRLLDVAAAVLVLGGLAPVWVVVAAAIKLDSRGPVLFRQERVGRDGRVFTMYKFRSMVEEAEEGTGPVWVKGADPRVTRMGRLLRGLHLDEIPQCLNFLRGDMSLVGPRPERPYFVEKFRAGIPFYMRRFNVKPGLLGWAQSKHEFDMDSTDLERIAAERLEYDLYYIENASLMLDFKIMLRTIWFVLAGKSTR